MPLNSAVVGEVSRPFEAQVDARWLMAYAAAALSNEDALFDTASESAIVAHPVFPVCLEWQPLQDLVNAPHADELTSQELARNVHASLDLHFDRHIRPHDQLRTSAKIIGIEKKGEHVLQHLRVDTKDLEGKTVCRSFQSGIFLKTGLSGSPRFVEMPPPWPGRPERMVDTETIDLELPRGLPHLYSEASRIWNPIHTDRNAARSAGLDDIILHGTATLAIAVTQLACHLVPGGTKSIHRVGCRFSAMVPLPSRISVRVDCLTGSDIHFSVLNSAGQSAIRDGFCSFREGFF